MSQPSPTACARPRPPTPRSSATSTAASGERAGYVWHARDLRDGTLQVYGYELASGLSWLRANPFVLAALSDIGHGISPPGPDAGDGFSSITFELGERHPLYEAIPEPPLYDLDRTDRYSFYVRVPDLPAFLRHVAPALEARLASSVAAGHTAGLKLSFYVGGLRLDLQRGRLAGVGNWSPTVEDPGHASFPDLTFLQLLFGHRSLQDLDRAFADCRPGNADTRNLLQALFPRRPSALWPVC